MPQRPQPCDRVLKDDMHAKEHGYKGWLREDANGTIRCHGYIGMFGDPCNECDKCPFHVHPQAEFWESEKPMEQVWCLTDENSITFTELPWRWYEKELYGRVSVCGKESKKLIVKENDDNLQR